MGSGRVPLPSDDDQPGGANSSRAMLSGSRNDRPGAVAGIDDLAVGDAELVEAGGPFDELTATRAAERDVIETRLALVERLLVGEVGKVVQAEQRVADLVDDVPERARVLVEDRCDAEDLRVPGLAASDVAHRHGDVGDGGDGW